VNCQKNGEWRHLLFATLEEPMNTNRTQEIISHPFAPIVVVDFYNHTIRQITEDGTVSTLCGSPGEKGSTDGKGSAARFSNPFGIAVSPNGTLFVADRDNHTIRKVTEDGTVSTLCGSPGENGSTDGKGSAARFNSPIGIAVSPNGALFVADYNNHTIRKITEDGTVSTLCGSPGEYGSTDGKGSAARFHHPIGIAVSPNGTIFVVDFSNQTIRKITVDGTVSTLCGSPGEEGSTDGKGSAARFNYPIGIAVSPNGTLFVTDILNYAIRKITEDGTVSTLCGSPNDKHSGSNDGKGSAATFSDPCGIAVSPDGTLFVVDRIGTIRKITEDGTVSTLCGCPGERGSTDGKGSAARFNYPSGIAIRVNVQWTPKTHSLFPLIARKKVMTVLMMAAKRQDGTPWHPESPFHSLPKDILFIILHSISLYDW
jgi:sugar lactone lactonase YvrE